MRADSSKAQLRIGWLLLSALSLGAGCERCTADAAPKKAPPAAVAPATLEGTLRLAEGFALPAYAPDAMEKRVFQNLPTAPLPSSCSALALRDRQPVQLTADGLLTGAMIAASGFAHQPSREPVIHDVLIRDCRLQPSLVVAMKGDRMRVRNEVDYPFMPGLGKEAMARTLSTGQVYDVSLDTPGVNALTCGFTAPCGRTDVVTMYHPLYAVSDATGHFRIEHFPTGERVIVSAWHPLFEERKVELNLAPGEHKQIELILTPRPAPEDSARGAGAEPPAKRNPAIPD